MDEFELELKMDFLEEAIQLLEDCEESFLELESGVENPDDHVDKIFRLAHNLKGTSRAVEFSDVAEFTHEMEELILKVKKGEVEISADVIDVFLKCSDHLNHMIVGLREDIEARFESDEIIELIKSVGSADFEHEELKISNLPEESEDFNEEVVAEDDSHESEDSDDLEEEELEEIFASDEDGEDEEALATRPSNDDISDLDRLLYGDAAGEEVDLIAPVSAEKPQENVIPIESVKKEESTKKEEKKAEQKVEPKQAAAAPKKPAKPEETIRIGVSRVEKLNNYVGELVILQTVLSECDDLVIDDHVRKSVSHLAKITKEIQDISMKMRMVPLKTTFSKLQRIVRDTSKALGKKVNLNIVGEDTEVDKNILEQLSDPLVHIVRNAVDHGLEATSDDRLAVGKSEKGEIQIKAYHEGNSLVIEVNDDGKGIDPAVIRNKAIEKGIIKSTDKIADQDAINLIFAPGFSTKEAVSEISGRGVGMDVVKRNIQDISGAVEVKSVLGSGSVFRIKLPLTMAIIEGMVTRVGSENYVVPLNLIHETLSVTEENYRKVNNVGGCVVLRGQVMPAFRLSKLLGHRPQEDNKNEIALVVRTEDMDFVIIVDDVLRRQQVVIKSLGNDIKNTQGFMGSSILGNGKPALILDLKELVVDKVAKVKNKSSIRNVA
ncbi:putative chemotaxis protein CheA [Halobacteriovorax sp. BALOs_7]|uniref:chemotaxis protein CheA n=1 Tax=Halobacteriovorax sp. BALOs_7 TaxID=2109558 RepID=UPI000EA17FB2|nr:chemotaxis protein CheA [Halobacteriovorax sp. BALOs_7]AYF43361.1 putative chemotaxis protein CheA [Halobacteriovorax sp. BALOs_7]